MQVADHTTPGIDEREEAQGEERASLYRDQRGATMVMGIFMACLLVGMLYYVMGIGETIMYRERMQDASDSGAFAAAVMHARGMNILALLNMVMAAVLGVLVAMKITLAIVTIAAAIASGICASVVGAWACPLAAALLAFALIIEDKIEATEPTIHAIVEVCHQAGEVVKTGIPLAAEAKVIQLGRETFNEPTEIGFMLPVLRDLPVEGDEGMLCQKAGEQAAMLFPTPFIGYPVTRFVPGWRRLVGRFARAFSAYLCGESADKAFQVKSGAELGDESFQLRAFMIGRPDHEWGRRGVAMAVWGDPESARGSYEALEQITKVSFAQAEFYFDDGNHSRDIDRKEWMWHMNWRARLRRFSMPSGGISSVCSRVSGACGAFDLIGDAGNVVVH